MKQLVLNEKELNELNAFLQEIPVKFGVPIINFLNAAAKRAAEEAPAEGEVNAEEAAQ